MVIRQAAGHSDKDAEKSAGKSGFVVSLVPNCEGPGAPGYFNLDLLLIDFGK